MKYSDNHTANELYCPSWQIQRKAAVIIAFSDGPMTCCQALDKAMTTVNNIDKRGSAAVVKGHSFRDAVAGGDRSALTSAAPLARYLRRTTAATQCLRAGSR